MKSAGVIVTYNRKQLLAENVKMQLKQNIRLDKLYIIDNNGTDSSYEYLLENKIWDNSWMEYVFLDENTGGAGGFYNGLKKAYEEGYDFIWMMDDDGRPFDENTWKEIYLYAIDIYKIHKELFLNSLVTVGGKGLTFGFSYRESKEQQWKNIKRLRDKNILLKGKANPFNGTLITKETVQKVGYPNKDFFMTRDETDYFRRCEDANVFIGTVLTSIYHHPKSKDSEKKFGSLIIPLWKSMDKEYYWVRNMTYSYMGKHKIRLFVLLCGQFIGILLWQSDKLMRIKLFFHAICDARCNKMGKRV